MNEANNNPLQENISEVSSNEPIVDDTKGVDNEITAEETEKITEPNATEAIAILEDKYLRLYADFENYKRRVNTERIELFKTANQEVLVALLPVLDDFGRALKAIDNAKDIEAIKEGIDLVNQKLIGILTSKGLKSIEAVGKAFDVEFHEAITNIPAPNDELKGKVIDEVEKGYFLNDKVIRFAKVVVGE